VTSVDLKWKILYAGWPCGGVSGYACKARFLAIYTKEKMQTQEKNQSQREVAPENYMTSDSLLRRYTNISALLHILRSQKITLLDPNNWEDKNDSHGMSVFKEKKKLKTVLGLCFTETVETYHHWHVFAKDASGVCITFNKDKLLKHIDKSKGFDYGLVEYKTLSDLRATLPRIDDLPFIKSSGYSDECEFRLIFKSSTRELRSKDISISIDCIAKIHLSPWVPKAMVKSLRETISSIPDCDRLNKYIFRSTLTGNSEWKELVSAAI
jgi:hypothetical protein